MNDPPKSLMTVPQLCSEIVQDGRTKYYIDWLEQVYRDQAARIQAQNDDQNKVGNERGLKALDNAFDQDTKNRRMEIKLLVDQRKKEGTQGHANRNK